MTGQIVTNRDPELNSGWQKVLRLADTGCWIWNEFRLTRYKFRLAKGVEIGRYGVLESETSSDWQDSIFEFRSDERMDVVELYIVL